MVHLRRVAAGGLVGAGRIAVVTRAIRPCPHQRPRSRNGTGLQFGAVSSPVRAGDAGSNPAGGTNFSFPKIINESVIPPGQYSRTPPYSPVFIRFSVRSFRCSPSLRPISGSGPKNSPAHFVPTNLSYLTSHVMSNGLLDRQPHIPIPWVRHLTNRQKMGDRGRDTTICPVEQKRVNPRNGYWHTGCKFFAPIVPSEITVAAKIRRPGRAAAARMTKVRRKRRQAATLRGPIRNHSNMPISGNARISRTQTILLPGDTPLVSTLTIAQMSRTRMMRAEMP